MSPFKNKSRGHPPPRSNITVFLEVFNEEDRIESCLKSFSWADELVVFDKQSTDRTCEIAKKYATEIISVPYTQASENVVQNISGRASCEWVFYITASSLIHPNLADEIIKLTTDNDFNYDVIGMPYAMYTYGISDAKSPWHALRKYILIRRTVLKLSTELHNEITFTSDKIYDMAFMKSDEVLYHCTHKDASDFFNRSIRYVEYDINHHKTLSCDQALKRSFIEILKSIWTVIFRRHTFLLGWDGVALSLAYICYFAIKFIYVWDSRRGNGNTVYPVLRKKMDDLWSQKNDYVKKTKN